MNGAHRSAASQMGDTDTSLADFGRGPQQTLRNIFVGKSVETIAPDSLIVEPARYGIIIRDVVMGPVKRGIEASDLGQRWKIGQNRADRREIVRLRTGTQHVTTVQ